MGPSHSCRRVNRRASLAHGGGLRVRVLGFIFSCRGSLRPKSRNNEAAYQGVRWIIVRLGWCLVSGIFNLTCLPVLYGSIFPLHGDHEL